MASVKRFTVYLSDSDSLDIEIAVSKGHVSGFTVNYRALIGTTWHEVVRYDCAHGYLHLHRFWLPKDRQSRPLENPKNPLPPYDDALTRAEEDLADNWSAYRSKMEGRVHGHD